MSKKLSTFSFNLSTVDHIGIGFFKYALGQHSRFVVVNRFLVQMLGYSSLKEFKRKDLFSFFVSSRDKNNFLNLIEKKEHLKFFETQFRKKNGKKVWVAITASCIRENPGKVYLEGIIEDITSHKEMEEKLALERDFLQNLLDNLPDAVYFKDKKNRIVRVNKFYAKGVGLKPEEIIGKTDFDFFPYEQAKAMFEDDNYVLTTGNPIVGKIERTLLPNGTWNQVITTKIPMYNRQGKIIGTMGITRDMTAYAHLERERLQMVVNALEALTRALEMRDPYTYGHARRVAYLAECIGKELGWDQNQLLSIRVAGQVHDIGKITVPLDILTKPGDLTELEYKMIQDHVEKGYQLLKDVKFPFPLAQIVYQHHERMDGSGYPLGLKGNQILLEARILGISDVLEAMTWRRPYREELGLEKAMEELRNGSGTKYDKDLIELVLRLIKKNNYTPFWMNAQ